MSDWSDGTYDTPSADSPYQIGSDTSWTPNTEDTLYANADIAAAVIEQETAAVFSGTADKPGWISAEGGGGYASKAPVDTGQDANTGRNEKSLWQQIMSADPRVQAAALTVGMGALSGMGAGYMTSKKQDDANKIAQQQVDINRQLASSQEALNKSKTSQDLSKFRFNPPGGLIDSAQKPFQPASQVDVTKRWRMPA